MAAGQTLDTKIMALIARSVDAGASASPGKTHSSPRKLSVTLRPFDCLFDEQRRFRAGRVGQGPVADQKETAPRVARRPERSWFVNICDVRRVRPVRRRYGRQNRLFKADAGDADGWRGCAAAGTGDRADHWVRFQGCQYARS